MNDSEIYSSFNKMIDEWLTKNNLPQSENVFEIMSMVVNNLGESWYRISLGKTRYN